MKKKEYIKPTIGIVLIAPQQFNLPASVPGGFPGIGIKGNAFDEVDEELDFEAAIGDLMP